uniref:Tail assembly chaperone n=1 Tax=viral metagenome TaxID=1070528 RepID=A0A6M3MBE4_9ZZZZ
MAEEKTFKIEDWAPKWAAVPIWHGQQQLRVCELTLHQRDGLMGLVSGAGGIGSLGELAAGAEGGAASLLVSMLGGQTTEFCWRVLANLHNSRVLGLDGEDAQFVSGKAEAAMKALFGSLLTQRQEQEVIRAFFEVEPVGELLGNWMRLLDGAAERVLGVVSGATGSQTETKTG